jgi:SNF2 family DNA or RNA helicase
VVFEYVGNQEAELANLLDENESTLAPFLFLDKAGTRALPPPEILAKFRIVITTTNRLRNEQKKGSFESELNASDTNVSNFTFDESYEHEACVLLKIRWFRLIIDEGHSMGMSKTGSAIQFASWISAERRWAMTGTPTKHGSQQVNQLNGLLHFLKHGFLQHDSTVTMSGNIQ